MATDIPGLGKANFSTQGVQGKALERMREELQILLGTRGDPLDAALTLRSAIERGLIDRIGNALGGSVTYVNTFPGYTVPNVGAYEPDLTPPPTPTGLNVSAGFSQVIVQWDAPTYTQGHGQKQTNVYAVKKAVTDASLPTFAAGVTPRVTVAPGALNIVALPSELNTRWHIWIAFETVDGVESVVPAGGANGYNVAGAYPTTGQDIAQLLEVLSGSITTSELAAALNTRINLIDASAGTAGSVNARIAAETSARGAALAALSAVKSRTFYSGSAPASDGSYTLQANDTWINTADANKLYRWTGSAWAAVPDTRIGQAVTDIANEVTNRTSADNAEIAVRESLYAGLGAAIGTDYKVFNQASTPTGTTIGDVWTWKVSGGAETFKRWNGSSWVDSLSDKRAAVYRGEYANAGALPSSGNVIGDLARRTDTNGVVVWNGASWAAKTSMPAPIYAFVESEKASRVSGDSAEASARDTLAAQLRGGYTGSDLAAVSSGLIYSEREARATAISAQATRTDALEAVVKATSLALPLDAWVLNGQSIVTVGDGKVGNKVLRLLGSAGAYPNQGNFIPIDRTKKYRVRFWARPSSDAAGVLYFSLRQFTAASLSSYGPSNGGRDPYKPSGITRANHNILFGTDQWGEYSYLWSSADWQPGVQFVQPDFLDNYHMAAGHWDVQDFRMEEVTAFESLSATVQDVTTVQADPTSGNAALASRASSLESTVNNGTTGVAATASALDVVEAIVTNGTSGNAALATRTTTLEARVTTPSADSGNPAYNATYAGLQTEQSVRAALDGAVQALYTVRTQLTAGGRTVMGGFGLAATATAGGGTTIDFGVAANRFYVGAPNDGSAPGIGDILPFIVQATPTTINGVSVPAGVYMDTAFIRNGSIVNAKIGDAAIDNAKIANLSAAKLTVGDGTVGGDLKSTSFSAGSGSTPGSGWKLTPSGTLYANNAVLYGTVYAAAGSIGGNTIDGSGIQSPGYSNNSAGWRVNSDGSAEFNNVKVRGSVGFLSNRAISGGVRVGAGYEQDTNGYRVYDAGGVARVELGYLP